MPPKAKTPSEEAAMESPKLDQMLAMLQGMSEKISEFDLRMVAVEKKSDTAREAVDAIKRVDKEVSPRKAKEVLGSKRKQFVAKKSLRSHGERRRRWKVRLKEQKTPFRE
jgi:hypothetical protein